MDDDIRAQTIVKSIDIRSWNFLLKKHFCELSNTLPKVVLTSGKGLEHALIIRRNKNGNKVGPLDETGNHTFDLGSDDTQDGRT